MSDKNNNNRDQSLVFLGYRQVPECDPREAQSRLDAVYERLIQAALERRAQRALDTGG